MANIVQAYVEAFREEYGSKWLRELCKWAFRRVWWAFAILAAWAKLDSFAEEWNSIP